MNGISMERLAPDTEALEQKMNSALAVCDKYLGNGLYTGDMIRENIKSEHYYFFLIRSEGKTVGIFSCYAEKYSEVVNEFRCRGDYLKADDMAGVCRSIAIEKEYRASGISEYVLNRACEILFENENVGLITILAWIRKDTNKLSAKRHLEICGFEPKEIIPHPWKKSKQLKCPACKKSPCECNGLLYIKKRKGI